MIQLLINPFGQQHPQIVLAITLLTATFVYGFIIYNHKLANYIKQSSGDSKTK